LLEVNPETSDNEEIEDFVADTLMAAESGEILGKKFKPKTFAYY
jgi:hypothetical protein